MSRSRRVLYGGLLAAVALGGYGLVHAALTPPSSRPGGGAPAGGGAATRSRGVPAGSLAFGAGAPAAPEGPRGAVAAAASYLRLLDRASLSSHTVAALRAVTLPPLTARAMEAEAAAAELNRRLSANGEAVIRGWRLGWRVLRFGSGWARVAVWTMGMVQSPRVLLAPVYSTTVCSLRATPGGWRVWAAQTEPGPTPAADGSDPNAVRAFVHSAAGFSPFDDAP